MRVSLSTIVVLLAAACGTAAPAAELPAELGTPIDLSAFSASAVGESADADAIADIDADDVLPVSLADATRYPRIYVAGIVGASFANMTNGGTNAAPFPLPPGSTLSSAGSVNDALFTGGGAIGLAFTRPSGQLRMEIEGRDRGTLSGETVGILSQPGQVDSVTTTTTASGVWSAMTNFWRDYSVTERFGVYGGGGFGIGGYQYQITTPPGFFGPDQATAGNNTINSFAWQVGTGVTYQASDRVSFDVGYRFFSIGTGSTSFSGPIMGSPTFFGDFTSAFSASELLLSVRIYEPFRNWR